MGHEERPQLIEQSSKRSKITRLVGVLVMLVSVVLAFCFGSVDIVA